LISKPDSRSKQFEVDPYKRDENMSHATDRRTFILTSLAGAAAGAGVINTPFAHAIEPIARTPGAHFKFSLAAYSYRDLLKAPKGKKPKLTLDGFIEDCAKCNLDGTELTSYYFPPNPTPDFLRQLKSTAFRRGLDISGTAVGNDFCFPPGKSRDQQIANVKRWIEYADLMDAPVIRIFSGAAKPGQSPDEARHLAIEAIEECCEYAGKYGVFLAIENHGGIVAEADGILAIVHGVNSPWFGVNMDTGNFQTADVYGDLAKIAPYSINVQVKISIHPAGKPAEPSDFKRLAQILKSSGYRGYIVLEYEGRKDPREDCPRYIDQIRAAFA
jgi:sugar phosphate isomerase/epimerase